MNNQQFSSSVGNVVDVATPATRKLKALGFVWALMMLLPLAVLNYLVIQGLTSEEPLITSHLMFIPGTVLMVLLGWASLGNAVQRFHAASSDDRYFRAGPGGISVSLPDDGVSASFRFAFKTVKFELPWEQVRTWYPFVQSMNGIPTDRSMVFENLKGEKVAIKTYHFAEKQNEIAARIERARSLPVTAVVQNVGETKQQANLPKGLAEASFEIKKKRDKVKEIDLRTVADGQRNAYVDRVAEVLEAKLLALFPGYRCSRKRYSPFPERKYIFGIRLFVQQGLLNGYEIQVEPNDSDCRALTISMCPSSLIADIRRYVAMAVGVVFVVLSIIWMPVIQNWLGDFSELTPLVMLVIILGALAGSAGLM